jgi:hypothetical protein
MKKFIAMLLIAGSLLSSNVQALTVTPIDTPIVYSIIAPNDGGGTGCSHHFVTVMYVELFSIYYIEECEFCGEPYCH